MKNNKKINYRKPPNSAEFDEIFGFFWNHGVGNPLDRDGDPRPWTPETLEAACEEAGKPVDRRTIQNWRSGKNKPGRRNMHVLAKVASGGTEQLRQDWADCFIATLDSPSDKTSQETPPTLEKPALPEAPVSPVKKQSNIKWPAILVGGAIAAGFVVSLFVSNLSSPAQAENMRVAVMPFENLSENSAETYISAGITDDIIQSLTQLPDLYVTPRRNSRSINRENVSIEEIGTALGVGHLLEGTMRVDEGRIKLNAYLTDIETGTNIWSGQFDTQSDDLFSIQERVADGVTQALDILRSPDWQAQMFNFGTENVEAYRQYLKGRQLTKFWHETHEGDDIWRGGEALEAAVAADPSMGRAWVHMTDLYHHYAAGHIGPPSDTLNVTVPESQSATMSHLRALFANGEKYGDETTALQARANRIFYSDNWAELRPAVLEYANKVTIERGELEWLYVPVILTILGETEAQIRLMDERVLKFDPGNGTGYAYIIRQYLTAGEMDLARQRFSEAEAITFSNRLAEVKGYMHVTERDGAALREHINSAGERLSPMLTDYFNGMVLYFNGNKTAAVKHLENSKPLAHERIHLGLAYHHMGQTLTAKRIFAEIAKDPIGSIQIAVQLSYGAACGPNPLPPIPPLDKRMADAGIAQLPCIGRAASPPGAESLQK